MKVREFTKVHSFALRFLTLTRHTQPEEFSKHYTGVFVLKINTGIDANFENVKMWHQSIPSKIRNACTEILASPAFTNI